MRYDYAVQMLKKHADSCHEMSDTWAVGVFRRRNRSGSVLSVMATSRWVRPRAKKVMAVKEKFASRISVYSLQEVTPGTICPTAKFGFVTGVFRQSFTSMSQAIRSVDNAWIQRWVGNVNVWVRVESESPGIIPYATLTFSPNGFQCAKDYVRWKSSNVILVALARELIREDGPVGPILDYVCDHAPDDVARMAHDLPRT